MKRSIALMAKSTAQRVREAEASHRARGEREIRVWVPDSPAKIKQIRDLANRLCKAAQAQTKPNANSEQEDQSP